MWRQLCASCLGRNRINRHSDGDTKLDIRLFRSMKIDTFALPMETILVDLDRYDDRAVFSLRLALEAVRLRASDFAYWQRRKDVERLAYGDRPLLIAFLLQQLLDRSFREMEGFLPLVKEYFKIEAVPDHSTLSRRFSSERWSKVLDRFFQHLLAALPRRKAVVPLFPYSL